MENLSTENLEKKEGQIESLEETSEYKNSSLNKNNSKTGLFIGIGIVLLILVGVAVWYFCFNKSTKNIYEVAIQKAFTEVRESLEKAKNSSLNIDYGKDVIFSEGTLELGTDNAEFDVLKDYKVGYELEIDAKNEQANISLDLVNKTDESVIDGNFYLVDNTVYMESAKLFNGLLSTTMDMNFDVPTTSLSYDSLIKMVNTTENAVLKFIRESKIDKTDKERMINNETKKVTDHAFIVNGKVFNRLVTELVDSYLADDSIIKEIALLLQMSEEELKENLEELKNPDNYLEMNEVTFHIYTTGLNQQIEAFALEAYEEEVLTGVVDKEGFTASIESDEINMSFSKKESKFNLDLQNEESAIVISYEAKNDNKETLEFLVEDKTSATKMDCTVTVEFNKETEQEGTSTMNGAIVMEVDGESMTFTIDLENRTSVNQKELSEIDTSNAKDVSLLTEEETTSILMNFYQILMNEESILEMFESLTGSL